MYTNRFVIASCVGLLAVMAGPVFSQEPAKASVMRQAHGAFFSDGVLHAGGSDYKARFDRGGFSFTPALGMRAPKNYPLRLTVEAVRRGDAQVWSAADAADVEPRLADGVAVYDRAPGFTERVQVRPDGLELSYVLDRPLGTAGDLVVRLRVDTELETTARGDSPGGVSFMADDLGGVRIGEVTGIDARDARTAGSLRMVGQDHLELVLPASFVDSAAYPLVLDPPISTNFLTSSGSHDDSNPDVAYDDTHNVYLVVWQRSFSVLDVEIRGQRVSPSGTLVGGFIGITSLATDIAINPTASNVNASDRFLVAWQQGPSAFGPWDVVGACVSPSTGAVSPKTTIAGGALVSEIDPDAACESSVASFKSLVVWSEDGDTIRVAPVTCPVGLGAPTVGPSVFIHSGFRAEKPAISKTTTTSGQHLIVWVYFAYDVYGVCVDRDGNKISPVTEIRDAGVGVRDPDVDGDGRVFMVAWAEEETFGATSHDIYCTSVQFDGTSLSYDPATPVPGGSSSGDDEIHPAVGYLWQKFVVAWADRNLSLQYDISVLAMARLGCEPCGQRVFVGGGGNFTDIRPEIASEASGGEIDYECLIVWMDAENTPPFESEIWAQRFEAFGPGGAITNVGGGCGLGGVAGGVGPFSLGNSSFVFTLSGADPASTGAVFVLGATTGPQPCGSCVLTSPLIQIPRPVTSGSAAISLPVPCNPAFLGGSVQAQWWVAGTSVTPCFIAPTVSFTDRLNLTIGL